MTQNARAQEPSMEEILASIRRIIADDDQTKAPPPPPRPSIAVVAPPPPPPPAPPPSVDMGQQDIDALLAAATPDPEPDPVKAPDILDLTDQVPVARPPVTARVEPRADIEFRAPPEPPRPIAERPAPAPRSFAPDSTIVSERTSVAVSAAFHSLTNTILSQNARTLEDLVEEMLRPMLKQWLDENLPSIVERMVRAEIERVSRGRG